jgi:L-aminopeptidase/D-esterase-like protein
LVVVVGAVAVVNAFGDVIDRLTVSSSPDLLSRLGPPRGGNSYLADTLAAMQSLPGRAALGMAQHANTVVAVVATNVALDKAQATKVAQMAHDGLARAIRPVHTMLDGDTVFALSTGRHRGDVTAVGAFAAEALSRAVLRAVRLAASAGGLPGLASLERRPEP